MLALPLAMEPIAVHRYCTDVVIHIHADLEDSVIHDIEHDIGCMAGVYSACVSDRARHLLLVDYDPEDIRAQDLLHCVQDRGVHAELIGL